MDDIQCAIMTLNCGVNMLYTIEKKRSYRLEKHQEYVVECFSHLFNFFFVWQSRATTVGVAIRATFILQLATQQYCIIWLFVISALLLRDSGDKRTISYLFR